MSNPDSEIPVTSTPERDMQWCIAQLRHVYVNLCFDGGRLALISRIEIADGLLAPVIRKLEGLQSGKVL